MPLTIVPSVVVSIHEVIDDDERSKSGLKSIPSEDLTRLSASTSRHTERADVDDQTSCIVKGHSPRPSLQLEHLWRDESLCDVL